MGKPESPHSITTGRICRRAKCADDTFGSPGGVSEESKQSAHLARQPIICGDHSGIHFGGNLLGKFVGHYRTVEEWNPKGVAQGGVNHLATIQSQTKQFAERLNLDPISQQVERTKDETRA